MGSDAPAAMFVDLGALGGRILYTLGMWSRYNSRPMPPVYGYDEGESDELSVLKPRETVEEIVRFWNAGDGRERSEPLRSLIAER